MTDEAPENPENIDPASEAPKRRGRPPKDSGTTDEAPENIDTVAMKRDPDMFPAPHTADVHPDEVENWKLADWVEA
jgi:hypothetical protein